MTGQQNRIDRESVAGAILFNFNTTIEKGIFCEWFH
jgi:hypothetical protein